MNEQCLSAIIKGVCKRLEMLCSVVLILIILTLHFEEKFTNGLITAFGFTHCHFTVFNWSRNIKKSNSTVVHCWLE